ncbi:glycosyltransferase [uncultured Sunxiuqinia sp.]|uniref:glycosyltransferase n=1 Tax=uncultured Sunxiuqinia sp. TaxID=1573825 RepID=UPI00263044C4|nr:glycosyltransferase [uncultured Sunxiuqinia sp.]
MKVGVYLETRYLKKKNLLFCEDIYTLLLNEISSHFDFQFIGRLGTEDSLKSSYLIQQYNHFFELNSYSNLFALFLKLPFYWLRNKKTIQDFIKKSDVLLVMTPSPISLIILKYAIRYEKKHCLLIRQNTREMIPMRYSGIYKTMARFIANYLETFVENFANKNNSHVLTLGPDIKKRYAHLSNNVREFVSSRYHINDIIDESKLRPLNIEERVRLLFVGRIEVNKGINELLSALKNTNIDYELSIVGDGQYMSNTKQLIKEYNLSNKIHLHGYIPYGPQLLDIYRSHDIFILPSYSEGLPQVVLEAMASGCLVLATNVGSIPSIINDGINGFIFKPKSVTALNNLFNQLRDTKSNYNEVRKNAIETSRRYAFENQSKVLIDTLKQ